MRVITYITSILGLLVLLLSCINHSPVNSGDQSSDPIIVDHTVVDKYASIPQLYIDAVKKMWVNIPGESHSSGYRIGLQFLEDLNSKYSVSVVSSGNPDVYTENALRISGAVRSQYGWGWLTGEDVWYTNNDGIDRMKNHITYCEENDLHVTAIGFGWCWDMSWLHGPAGSLDPVYKVRWAGTSVGGADGDTIWGLDADDTVLTGNSVCMDTYLNATEQYISHCETNGYTTRVIFTTGPVDGYTGENGYQRYVKHEYIRNYVKGSTGYILFDYADILSRNDTGQLYEDSWINNFDNNTVYSFPAIHPDNMFDDDLHNYTEDGDHIGKLGALRLGKAIWYMMARIAGWDGVSQ